MKSVQVMKWYEIRVVVIEGNSGTTLMLSRSDPLVTAARLTAAMRDTAVQTGLDVCCHLRNEERYRISSHNSRWRRFHRRYTV